MEYTALWVSAFREGGVEYAAMEEALQLTEHVDPSSADTRVWSGQQAEDLSDPDRRTQFSRQGRACKVLSGWRHARRNATMGAAHDKLAATQEDASTALRRSPVVATSPY